MTYREFVKAYINPNKVSDEQAKEGTYYTRAIFDNLEDNFCMKLGEILANIREEHDCFKTMQVSDMCWIKIVLSTLSAIVTLQGSSTNTPRPYDEIPRANEGFMFSAHIVNTSELINQKPEGSSLN